MTIQVTFLSVLCTFALALFTCASASDLEKECKKADEFYHQGITLYEQDEFDKATAAFTQAIELSPMHARAYCKRGLVYNAKGQDDLAIADYSQAIKLDPKYSEAYYYRSMTYYLKGDYDKAREDVAKAKDLGCQVCPAFLEQLRSGSLEKK